MPEGEPGSGLNAIQWPGSFTRLSSEAKKALLADPRSCPKDRYLSYMHECLTIGDDLHAFALLEAIIRKVHYADSMQSLLELYEDKKGLSPALLEELKLLKFRIRQLTLPEGECLYPEFFQIYPNPFDAPHLVHFLASLSREAQLAGDWPAVERLQRALFEREPDNLMAALCLARALIKQGKIDEGRAILNDLGNRTSGLLEGTKEWHLYRAICLNLASEDVRSLVSLSREAQTAYNWPEVERLQRTILERDPDSLMAALLLARALIKQGKADEGRAILNDLGNRTSGLLEGTKELHVYRAICKNLEGLDRLRAPSN